MMGDVVVEAELADKDEDEEEIEKEDEDESGGEDDE